MSAPCPISNACDTTSGVAARIRDLTLFQVSFAECGQNIQRSSVANCVRPLWVITNKTQGEHNRSAFGCRATEDRQLRKWHRDWKTNMIEHNNPNRDDLSNDL